MRCWILAQTQGTVIINFLLITFIVLHGVLVSEKLLLVVG